MNNEHECQSSSRFIQFAFLLRLLLRQLCVTGSSTKFLQAMTESKLTNEQTYKALDTKRNFRLCSLHNKLLTTESKVSTPLTQKLSTGPYPEPMKLTPHSSRSQTVVSGIVTAFRRDVLPPPSRSKRGRQHAVCFYRHAVTYVVTRTADG